jgi:predicted DNA-binding protein (UPF0251 family)
MRAVRHDPSVVYFKPAGVPIRVLEEVALGLDELEAIRLADVEGLSHEEVGKMMNVSRATAGRILAEARRKTAIALVYGLAIRVEGGAVETIADEARNPRLYTDGRRGRGKNSGRK